MQVPLSTKLELETYTRLQELSRQTGQAMTKIIDIALREYMDKLNRQPEQQSLYTEEDITYVTAPVKNIEPKVIRAANGKFQKRSK